MICQMFSKLICGAIHCTGHYAGNFFQNRKNQKKSLVFQWKTIYGETFSIQDNKLSIIEPLYKPIRNNIPHINKPIYLCMIEQDDNASDITETVNDIIRNNDNLRNIHLIELLPYISYITNINYVVGKAEVIVIDEEKKNFVNIGSGYINIL